MSDKRSQVLILDPPVDLVFKGPFTEVVTSTLSLQNPTNDPVIFKVKTTAPKQYCVRPNSGLLGPKEEAIISVMLQPFDHSSAEKSKHKFMVQTMLAPPRFKLDNLDAVWRDAGKSQLMDSKLRCVFLDSSGNLQDPTSSAVSVSPNEGAPSNQAAEETFKSSSIATPALTTTTTPKQAEVVTSTQSTAGSTPAHVGGANVNNKEMEKAAAESKVRMLQDRIDQLSSENIQLKSESNKLRQRIGAGAGLGKTSALAAISKRAGSLSVIAIIFILVAIILGYLVGKWL